jgi:hypothetical protein
MPVPHSQNSEDQYDILRNFDYGGNRNANIVLILTDSFNLFPDNKNTNRF